MCFPTFQLANTRQSILFTAHDKVITFHHLNPPLALPNIKSVFVKQTKAMLDDYLFDRRMKNIEYVIDN